MKARKAAILAVIRGAGTRTIAGFSAPDEELQPAFPEIGPGVRDDVDAKVSTPGGKGAVENTSIPEL
jgi:hypothetical protein